MRYLFVSNKMKLVLYAESTSKILKLVEMFKVVKNISSHCTFYCKDNGIHIQIMDSSHTSLMDINISKDWFDEYEGNNNTLSVDSSLMVKIMSLYSPQTQLVLYNTNKLDKLYIDLEFKTGIEKNFAIPLFDIECDVMEAEIYDYSLEFSMSTKLLDKYVTELMIFSESGSVSCKNDNICFKSAGNEGKYVIKVPYDNLVSLEVEEDLKLSSTINLKLLQNSTKFCNVFKEVSVKVDPQKPMLITFDDSEEEEESDSSMTIHYFIAPKIMEDDEVDNDSDSDIEEEGNDHKSNYQSEFDNLGENIVEE